MEQEPRIGEPSDIALNQATGLVSRDGYDETVILSRNRAIILNELMKTPGKTVSRKTIEDALYSHLPNDLWPKNYRTIDVMLSYMRGQLQSLDLCIFCVRNQGWFLTTKE